MAEQGNEQHLSLLREMCARMDAANPRYEISPVYTIGGPTGSYELPGYFATPAEYQVVAVSFEDTGSVAVSLNAGLGAPSLGSTLDPARNLPGLVLASTNPQFVATWQPMPAQAALYVVTTIASSHSAYVAVQFRRRVHAGVPVEG